MNLRYKCEDDPLSYCYKFEIFEEHGKIAEDGLIERFSVYNDPLDFDFDNGPRYHAWVPAYDNYDGTERFWRHYELSLMEDDQRAECFEEGLIEEYEVESCEWCYTWSVSIYYSVLVIGGNEM